MTTTTQTRPADAQDRPARTQTGMLIIGASQAGVQLAISLRGTGFTESITLLGEEDHRPYQRPALSKEFLQGTVDKENLIFRSAEYWDEHNIELVKNSRIEKIEKNPDGSGVAIATDGEEYPFARLALAVGARARPLEVPGSDLSGVTYLRSADDALSLKGSLTTSPTSSSSAADSSVSKSLAPCTEWARTPPCSSTAPDSSGAPSEKRPPSTSTRRTGTVNSTSSSTPGSNHSSTTAADVCPEWHWQTGPWCRPSWSSSVRRHPEHRTAEQMGLETGPGSSTICAASDGTTIAVRRGEHAQPAAGRAGGERIRLESVNAIEHAKVAAYSVSGRREEYAGIPWFWSNQADMKLQIAGLSMGFDSTVVRRDDEKGKFSVLYYCEGQIIAADCVNAPLDFMAVRTALAKNQQIPADQAGDMNVMLKSIAVDREDSR